MRVASALACGSPDALRRAVCYRRYTLLIGAQAVDVTLMVLEGQGEDGQPAPVVPGLWLVRRKSAVSKHMPHSDAVATRAQLEASCKTTQETYIDAIAALAVVKEQLAAVVSLERPALHLHRAGEAPPPPLKPLPGTGGR